MWFRIKNKFINISANATAETSAARQVITAQTSGVAQKELLWIDTTVLKKTAEELPRNSELRELLILLPDRAETRFLLYQVRTWRALARMEDMNSDTDG